MGTSQQALLEIRATVQRRDFEMGYYLARKLVSPLHLPRVQAGLCLTGAALCATMIPTCSLYLGSVWAPVCGIGFFVFLAGLFGWLVPSMVKSRGGWMYQTNRTLSLPYTMRVFEDRFEWENEYERICAHWTDVDRCYENRQYYVLRGDLEKPLLVIPKKAMDAPAMETLSRFLKKTLAVRYRGG